MNARHVVCALLLCAAHGACVVVAGNYLCDDGRCPDGQTCTDADRCVVSSGDEQGEGEGEGESPLQWAGSWAVLVELNVTCRDTNNDVETTGDTATARVVRLVGENAELSADIDIVYGLRGAGTQQRLTLAGSLPLSGTTRDETANFSDCQVTLSADVVDDNTASGAISGAFSTAFTTCTINSGSVTLSR